MERYFQAVQDLQRQVIESQRETLEQVAAEMLGVVQRDGRIFIFGTGHSHLLAEEGFYRAGGLAAITPIFDPALMLHEGAERSGRLERTAGLAGPLLERYHPQPGELLIVVSNSGVNRMPVEMALAGRALGLKVVALLSRAYAAVAPLSDLGLRLDEAADYVIDNGGRPGDALVALDGSAWRAGPSSTVIGALLLNGLVTEVVARLAAQGGELPVFASHNLEGAREHNRALLDKWRAINPHL
ncbi:MAG: SIS domain-containing protein [Chloroflexota bacterium]